MYECMQSSSTLTTVGVSLCFLRMSVARVQANAYAYPNNDCYNENKQQTPDHAPQYDCKDNAVVVRLRYWGKGKDTKQSL